MICDKHEMMFSEKKRMTANCRGGKADGQYEQKSGRRREKSTNEERNDDEDAKVEVLLVPPRLGEQGAGEEGAKDEVERRGETGVDGVVERDAELLGLDVAEAGFRVHVLLLELRREHHCLLEGGEGGRSRDGGEGRSLRNGGSADGRGHRAGEGAGASVRRATNGAVED
jgi:hypothetical protein